MGAGVASAGGADRRRRRHQDREDPVPDHRPAASPDGAGRTEPSDPGFAGPARRSGGGGRGGGLDEPARPVVWHARAAARTRPSDRRQRDPDIAGCGPSSGGLSTGWGVRQRGHAGRGLWHVAVAEFEPSLGGCFLMAESIGLIERAAALLRQREAENNAPPAAAPAVAPPSPAPATTPAAAPAPAAGAAVPAAPGGGELILDRGQLASYGVAVPSAERSRTAEEFRLVKRNLMTAWTMADRTGEGRFNRIVMVTSARPGEGKTFVALNLALSFSSEREVKALLVDADTHVGARHSAIKAMLGERARSGLVDVLAGSVSLDEALIRTNIENLLLLPAGQGGPHVPELFSSSRMSVLVSELTRRFPDRFVVLDTPPCMVSSDAATMAPLVGQIVFVVEAYRTQQDEVEAGLSMLSACPRISLLLNKSEQATAHFGSYSY